jgi:hypothetical protein
MLGLSPNFSDQFAVILGLSLNKEKIGKHQKVGLAIALISAITLSYFGS